MTGVADRGLLHFGISSLRDTIVSNKVYYIFPHFFAIQNGQNCQGGTKDVSLVIVLVGVGIRLHRELMDTEAPDLVVSEVRVHGQRHSRKP